MISLKNNSVNHFTGTRWRPKAKRATLKTIFVLPIKNSLEKRPKPSRHGQKRWVHSLATHYNTHWHTKFHSLIFYLFVWHCSQLKKNKAKAFQYFLKTECSLFKLSNGFKKLAVALTAQLNFLNNIPFLIITYFISFPLFRTTQNGGLMLLGIFYQSTWRWLIITSFEKDLYINRSA